MAIRDKKQQQRKRKNKKKEPSVSYYKKPDNLSLAEWQRELRKAFVRDKKQTFTITPLAGAHLVFTDYTVENPASSGVYKVALRSREPGPNFCTCMDFKTNMLGTCKHIEAVIRRIMKNTILRAAFAEEYRPAYTSLYLKYGADRRVMIRIGTEHEEKYEKLAREYFDTQYCLSSGAFDRIDQFLEDARRISADFRCYPDALDFIIATRDDRARKAIVNRKVTRNKTYFDRLLTTPLYPFQQEGVLFALRAGRCLIADEMGLGKTLQAIALAEVLKKEFGIGRILIVCPTSLKYQWQSEIAKFTESSATVVEGNFAARRRMYGENSVYTIASYNVVGADLEVINKTGFDLVILDEAQRIKNWKTKTAREVKKIQSTYAVVLTGTPIENKLEELYSIIQFIDPFKLGPLYTFLEAHQIRDEAGKVIGYRELNKIKTLLSDIVIRRTKKEVLKELPGRTDKQLFVPLTAGQEAVHQEYAEAVSRLVHKWKRLGFLDEKDRQRLLISLNCMRMVSDSTYILDQETRHDTKIGELMSILETALSSGEDKVVIFSQWERMTRLVAAELENRTIGFANLHGGIESRKRKDLLTRFHSDPLCRVFLSTDAGGVGLNLQCASLVINLDLPWNPAVLEQRIGRIHRHGQKRNVTVINLISRASIEERMLGVLQFKSSLFKGALDGGEDEIFMGDSKFKQFMQSVETITDIPTVRATPVTDVETNDAVGSEDDTEKDRESMAHEQGNTLVTDSDTSISSEASNAKSKDVAGVAELFTSAAQFFGNLATTLSETKNSGAAKDSKTPLSSFMEKDSATGKSYLRIPVESEVAVGNAIEALNALLTSFRK